LMAALRKAPEHAAAREVAARLANKFQPLSARPSLHTGQ
jgi:hypothetical protein